MKQEEILHYIRLFREKTQTNKLIVFVGAGVSKNIKGMPDWNDLIVKMAEAINYSKCNYCKKRQKIVRIIVNYMTYFLMMNS